MIRYFDAIYAIVKKDVVMEFRTKEVINSMIVFGLLVVIVFSFIFEPASKTKNEVVGGIFWVSVIFSALLGLGKTMVSEVSGGNLEALVLAPIDASAIFFGKFISNFLFISFMEIILLPLFAIFYDVNLVVNLTMVLIIFLATYGFALLGTLFSLIAVKTKTREVMLPLLLLPIMVPVILAAILSTNIFVLGEDPAGANNWIILMASFDLIFSAVILVMFSYIIEE